MDKHLSQEPLEKQLEQKKQIIFQMEKSVRDSYSKLTDQQLTLDHLKNNQPDASQLRALHLRMALLHQNNEQLKQTIHQMGIEYSELEKKNKSLENTIQDHLDENEFMESKRREISNAKQDQDKINQIHIQQLLEKEREINSIRQSYEATINTLKIQCQESANGQTTNLNIIKDYEQKFNMFLEFRTGIELELKQYREVLGITESEVNNGNWRSKTQAFEMAHMELQSTLDRFAEIQAEMTRMKLDNDQYQEIIEQRNLEIIEKEQIIKEKDTQIIDLQNKLNQFQDDTTKDQFKSPIELIKDYKRRLIEQQAKYELLEQTLQNQEFNGALNQFKFDKLKESSVLENDVIKSQNIQLTEKLEQCESELEAWKGQFRQLEEKYFEQQEIEIEQTQLNDQIKEMKIQIKKLKQQIKEQTATIHQLQSQNEFTKEEMNVAELNEQKALQKLDDQNQLVNDVNQLQKQNKKLLDDANDWKKRFFDLNSRVELDAERKNVIQNQSAKLQQSATRINEMYLDKQQLIQENDSLQKKLQKQSEKDLIIARQLQKIENLEQLLVVRAEKNNFSIRQQNFHEMSEQIDKQNQMISDQYREIFELKKNQSNFEVLKKQFDDLNVYQNVLKSEIERLRKENSLLEHLKY